MRLFTLLVISNGPCLCHQCYWLQMRVKKGVVGGNHYEQRFLSGIGLSVNFTSTRSRKFWKGGPRQLTAIKILFNLLRIL